MPGFVIHEGEVEPRREPGDTAETRVAIDASQGRLEQRVERFAPGRSNERSLDGRLELLYVAAGRGRLLLDGDEHVLEPDTAAFVAPGERYAIENDGPKELVLVTVSVPGDAASWDPDRRRTTIRFEDQPTLRASQEREFRYLVNEDAGCLEVTQFVGIIEPGPTPMHAHTYDEVVYVIEGEGVVHLDGKQTPMRAGTCIHLPPLHEHSLENTGETPMRVLGVFHPSGDPASRAG